MNLDQRIAAAKERLHRSIGQRAGYVKRDLSDRAAKMQDRLHQFGRARPRVVFNLSGIPA